MDKNFTNEEENMQEEESFEELLAKTWKQTTKLEPGQKVEATVIGITPEWIFIDTGRKGEGVIDRKELTDKEGTLSVNVGDTVAAYFLAGSGSELKFTTKIGGGAAGLAALQEAYRSGIPVEGFVEKEVKGGFEVKIAGTVRAFCPYSLMALRRTDKPEEFLGKHLAFRISEFGERGRNVVLSHRAILEEEREKLKEQLKETLQEGAVVNAVVTSLRDFGAFVELGGAEALLPISEIGWSRVADVKERLSVGQELQVTVKKLDWANDRLTVSLKDTLADPWQKVRELFPEGSYHTGKVVRLTNFGAFVSLGEGIDGLIHISKLGGGKRINHPREVVSEGDMLEVKIEAVDVENRKLSLGLAGVAREKEESEKSVSDYMKAASAPRNMGSLGELLKAQMEKKGRK